MRLPEPRFTVRRMGYSYAQVDAFIEALNSAVRNGERVLPEAVGAARFSLSTDMGYAVAEVDAWLEDVRRALADGTAEAFRAPRAAPPAPSARPMPSASDGAPATPTIPGLPAPQEIGQLVRNLLPSRSPATGGDVPVDPVAQRNAEELGRNAVQELPATPPWATILLLVTVAGLIAVFAWQAFGG